MSSTILANPAPRRRAGAALVVMFAMVALLFSPLATSQAAADGTCANTYHTHWYGYSYRTAVSPSGSLWRWTWRDHYYSTGGTSGPYYVYCGHY